MTSRAGHPHTGGRDTRADLVLAARTLFASLGFERTTMRAVATRAGVDVALIYFQFGSKARLLEATLAVPASAQRIQELHSTSVLVLVSEVAAEDQRELRAALIGVQLSGLLLMRYLFKVSALATVDPIVLTSAVAPTIELYLTGDLGNPDPPTSRKRRPRKPWR